MMTNLLKTCKYAPFILGASVLSVYAQDVTPVETDEFDDDVFELSPFEVSTDSNVGYLATSTLAGTRIRTDLKDVGSAISVVTKEFLQDTGAVDNSTLLQYTTNAEVSGTRGTYAGLGNGTSLDETANLRSPSGAQRVRGLAAADNTRDFFVTEIPWDSYTAGRIDIQRGPNSILFGLGSPAGIVNASMDSAEFYEMNEVTLRMGSYGSGRATLDINRVLIEDELAVRVEGLWDHEKFRQDPAFEDDERIYAAVRWEPKLFDSDSAHTVIKANFESGKIDANRPRIIPPLDGLSGWFNPLPTNGTWGLNNGMGKTPVTNGYDAQATDVENFPAGNPYYGMNRSETANYQPYLSGVVNAQQPLYFIDGGSGVVNEFTSGWMNIGAINADGSPRGFADGVEGVAWNLAFFQIDGLAQYAFDADLPLAGSGQYRNTYVTDPSVFNFYDTLIDGDNKWEMEEWTAYSVDITQSFFNDRLAFQAVFDKQKYEQAQESLIRWTPKLTIDVMQNLQHFVAHEDNDGETSVTNANYGRPMVITNGGNGRSYETDRESMRASMFGEFRVEDVSSNDFLVKLFGKHRFNAVASKDTFANETKAWYNYANTLDWAAFWNGNDGKDTAFWERGATAAIYLGDSLAGANSLSGANIPGLSTKVTLPDMPVRIFNPVWTATNVDPGAVWTPSGNLSKVWRSPTDVENGVWYENSNPANYEGWTYRDFSLLRYNNGANDDLLDNAAKAERVIKSQAVSMQSYWWNDALVTTVGWRKDRVEDRDVQASRDTLNRSILDTSDSAYRLPSEVSDEQIFEDESLSYGAVLHLNNLLEKDPLPVNVSISYNESENFQITSTRRDIYGNIIDNPSGKTKDVGVLLATKDNRFSVRLVKYETKIQNGSSRLSGVGNIGSTIQQGLRFRNVFLYDLGGYTWDTRETDSYRNRWINPYGDEFIADRENPTAAELAALQAEEDAAIQGWNDIQAWHEEKGFFEAWDFSPVPLANLTTRSVYEATLDANGVPAAQYLPPEGSVVAYAATEPQGFAVTEDSISEGYELEITANPTANWRISMNASKTEATRMNVGGENLTEWVEYMNSQFVDSSGNLTPAAKLVQWGNAGLSVYKNRYLPFLGNYTLMKLNEGTPTPEIRKWRFNFVTNYAFTDGKLRGLSVGGSYRWQDKVAIGYPVIETDTGFYFDKDNPAFGPAETAIDLWCSYSKPINDKIDWKIQLNIRNAGKGDDLIPISVQPDGKTVAGYRIAPTQEWFITNTFSF